MTLSLQDVSFSYGTSGVGVSNISFDINAGEFVAVIGPSGCGKTTVLKLIAGFLTPNSGRIMFGETDATRVPTRSRELGIVFQNYALFPHMTATENIAYPLKLRNVPVAECQQRALEAVSMVGLSAFANRRPAEMSGGQQQRIALARALVFRPRALLLDEPLSALDAARRVEMRDEIKRLQRLHGIATLHITHDQEEALSMADNVIVMAQGRILQSGTPREIYDSPTNRTVAAFVGHANLWDGQIIDGETIRTPIGVLRSSRHGHANGTKVAVLVRPERVRLGEVEGTNILRGQILRDRFLGSLRRLDMAVGDGTLTVETSHMAEMSTVSIPPEAVQVLPVDHA